MGRPTIRDLANAAGVSVSTVNRVLGGTDKVRQVTMERVLQAAEEIGFYGIGSIQGQVAAARPQHRLGILLQQPNRPFYQAIARSLEVAASAVSDRDVQLFIEFLDDLSPDYVSARMLDLGARAECVAVVAAEHPIVTEAIEALWDRGVPVFGLISQLSARCNVNYVGLDNWKVGRTAAWAFENICKQPGKIGILVGNHRYRCQELNESGFRSYFREHATNFTLLEPLSTFETSAISRELTEGLLSTHSDLAGLYVAGGGITGVLAALRNSDRTGRIVTVGHELFDVTRRGLLDGSLTLVISHPLETLASETIAGMMRAVEAGAGPGNQSVVLNFDIVTRENI